MAAQKHVQRVLLTNTLQLEALQKTLVFPQQSVDMEDTATIPRANFA
jgi:hypothetical protein